MLSISLRGVLLALLLATVAATAPLEPAAVSCPSLVERLIMKAHHAQCFVDTAIESPPSIDADSEQAIAAFCQRSACRAAIDEVLSLPWINGCVMVDARVVTRSALQQLTDSCQSTAEARRRLRHASEFTWLLVDGESSPRTGVVLGLVMLVVLICLAFSLCPRRQSNAMSGKHWLCGCIALPLPAIFG